MIEGVDCASSVTADAAAGLKAAGRGFVCRYVSTIGNPKNLTAAEARRLKAAGLDVVVVFETTADRALAGRPAGVADAKAALAQAVACGMPSGRPIFFAVDFDVSSGQKARVISYIAGAASVLGKHGTGVYGGLGAVKAVLDAAVCSFAWQTYAWSGGVWDRRAQLQQYENGQTLAGLSVDFDRAVSIDYGQWGVPPARRKIIGYTLSVIDAQGRRVDINTRTPTLWLARHPRAKKRGRIIQTRRFGK